jgi:hypothetical protein
MVAQVYDPRTQETEAEGLLVNSFSENITFMPAELQN